MYDEWQYAKLPTLLPRQTAAPASREPPNSVAVLVCEIGQATAGRALVRPQAVSNSISSVI
jgi:hypothetical protein